VQPPARRRPETITSKPPARNRPMILPDQAGGEDAGDGDGAGVGVPTGGGVAGEPG
jgi:hypothetical protein